MLAASLCFGESLLWQSPSPSPSEAAALLKVLCPGDVQLGSGAPDSLTGCKTCPEFTGESGATSVFNLQTVTYGSFTASGVDEAVASFYDCESHATGLGGSILFRKKHGSWAMVDYKQGLLTSACHIYRLKTGRDLLLCDEKDFGMGTASHWIFVCDFSKKATLLARSQTVFEVVDRRSGLLPEPTECGSIEKAALRDLNGDGMPDLTVWVVVRGGTFTSAEVPCKYTTSPPVQEQKLDFLFQQDTNTFVAAPWSKALKERLYEMFRYDYEPPESH
jgi:hypothetical protein